MPPIEFAQVQIDVERPYDQSEYGPDVMQVFYFLYTKWIPKFPLPAQKEMAGRIGIDQPRIAKALKDLRKFREIIHVINSDNLQKDYINPHFSHNKRRGREHARWCATIDRWEKRFLDYEHQRLLRKKRKMEQFIQPERPEEEEEPSDDEPDFYDDYIPSDDEPPE